MTIGPEIIPVPIRRDLSVKIYGIPWDLTRKEADKLARVVKAMQRLPERDKRGRFVAISSTK